MAGRGDQADSEPLGVIDRRECLSDLDLAAVAGTGVDVPDL
jgi:hypothetical protein